MTVNNQRLWRCACQAHKAYSSLQPKRSLSFPAHACYDAAKRLQQLRLSNERGWHAAEAKVRQAFFNELERLQYQLTDLANDVRLARRSLVPPLKLLFEELVSLRDEFDSVDINGQELVVTTERVELEGVPLGEFEIRLDLARINGERPYRIVALTPHLAASSDCVTHPHVNGERLCAGEGHAAIRAALAEGRLADFFIVVDRILHSYSEGNAYVELDRWYGVPCNDCDVSVDDDDVCSCTCCEETLCSDCFQLCDDCGNGYCHGCIDSCAICEEARCHGCLQQCSTCSRRICSGCCQEQRCSRCLEENTNEETEKMEEKEPAAR